MKSSGLLGNLRDLLLPLVERLQNKKEVSDQKKLLKEDITLKHDSKLKLSVLGS